MVMEARQSRALPWPLSLAARRLLRQRHLRDSKAASAPLNLDSGSALARARLAQCAAALARALGVIGECAASLIRRSL
eukprot:4819623-Alexandrium_andersonii.AAC.1